MQVNQSLTLVSFLITKIVALIYSSKAGAVIFSVSQVSTDRSRHKFHKSLIHLQATVLSTQR